MIHGCLTAQCRGRVGGGCLVIRGRVMGGLWQRGSARPGLCMLAWLALSPDSGGRGRLFLSLLSFRGALDPLSYEFSGCGGLSCRSAPLLWTECPLPWDFPGKSTGVGCHFLLQRIFPTQGSNLGHPHCRQTLYRLSHQESYSTPTRDQN